MPSCSACSAHIADDARFCPSCGTALGRNPAGSEELPPTEAVDPDPSSHPSSEHGRFLPGAMLGTRYRMVGLLGRGGMGEVYRADDLELGQSVALKFLPEKLATDSSALERIRREVRTARGIAHPNVCRVYDIAEVDGHVFLSMEYVDGDDLSHVLRRLGPPSRSKAVEIARQICLGLAAAHESEVLHRDLKPANVMLDGRGRVRISDFGLAGLMGELQAVSQKAGTPAYMAPEQFESGRVSVRSDIYSLGLLLFELFTGKRAFEGATIDELRRARSTGSVPSMQTGDEAIDPAIERVIRRCLEPDPADRPPSVYAVLAALPGGDPLAAALAAGETPSPELVVNARDVGGSTPRGALGLLATVLVSLAVYFVIVGGSTVMPEKPPAVLGVLAEQVLDELGFADLPRNSVSGLDVNFRMSQDVRRSTVPFQGLAAQDRPFRFRFWKRWTRGALRPAAYHAPELYAMDGETTTPEWTATVALDSSGRLLHLEIPAALDDPNRASGAPEPADWSTLFRLAGLEESAGVPVAPLGWPPVPCSQRIALQFDGLLRQGEPATVQMGARDGRPVYFEIMRLEGDVGGFGGLPFVTTFAIPYVREVLLFTILVLAIRNLRSGRSDRRNAVRAGLVIGGLYALLEIFSLPFGGPINAARIATFLGERAIGHILLHTVEAWLTYLAVEPYVRRVWPRMLVGVLRLFTGRGRNPVVGREILFGAATGCGLLALYALLFGGGRLQSGGAGHLPSLGDIIRASSALHHLALISHRAAWVSLDGVFFVGLLVALRLIGRHTAVAAVVGMAVLTGMGLFGGFMRGEAGPPWLVATYVAVCGASLVALHTRVGFLAGVTASFVLYPYRLPTPDLEAWWAPHGIVDLAIPLVLAGFGFWVALAGRPIFTDMLAEFPADDRVVREKP